MCLSGLVMHEDEQIWLDKEIQTNWVQREQCAVSGE